MTAIVYPIHFQRKFERRWANRVARYAVVRKSRPEGTDTCACGHDVTAPYSSNYTPKAVINRWHCSACGADWRTSANVRRRVSDLSE
jgi:hypothetical protein